MGSEMITVWSEVVAVGSEVVAMESEVDTELAVVGLGVASCSRQRITALW